MAEIGLEKRSAGFGVRLSPELRIQLFSLMGIWALWEAMSQSGLFYRDIVPSSFKVFAALGRHLVDPGFYVHLGTTAYEVAVGFTIGSLIGLGLGILFGVRRFLGRVMDGYILALAPAPKVIFLPILMILFGVGPGSKIAMGAVSAFFPVVLSTVAGMLLVNQTLVKVAESFNTSPLQMVTKVYLPSLVLPVITGLRIGLGVAIIGTLIAEIKLSNAGLGFLAIQYYDLFQIPDMYAVIIVIFAIAMGVNMLMSRLNDRLGRRGMPATAEVSGAA
ncbi:MAG: ABC transporter permease [Alphaproteobacteria bacterium]|nr:ABC transporter permease [Alphaproteobacteria bacterium]